MMHDEGDYGRTAYDGDPRDQDDWDVRRQACWACGGSGGWSASPGSTTDTMWVVCGACSMTCPECEGTGHFVDDRGEVYEDTCETCWGARQVRLSDAT